MLFGTAYYPDHWPESDWPRDLDRICEAGIKAVRFGEFSWSWYEPAPGKFDFKAFDRFIALVEQRSLRLILCTPTATPPPWFDRLYPDGRLRDMDGRQCHSVRHFWCWNHAASRSRAEKTIRRLAHHYRDCTALWGWQIDNEPNYAEEDNIATRARMYDFHPAAFAAFIQWLHAKYISLDALNAAWWSNFWSQRHSAWQDIVPHRINSNPHAWLDFMRWREANLAVFVHWQADLLREITPRAQIGCNIPETGVKLSVSIGQDYWSQARGLDWVGTDLYQATGNRPRDLEKLAYSTDLMRSAATAGGAQFVLSETQAGPHERAWPMSFAGETFDPRYLEQSAHTYASRGAEQIWWFLWRPTHGGWEIGMNGLQNLDGTGTPRTAAVRKLSSAAALRTARPRWLERPPAYIHYSRDSLLYASTWPDQLPALEASLTGWHALLEQAGYRVEFLNDEALLAATLDPGQPLILPHTTIASDSLVNLLTQTKAHIFAGPHTALLNEHGHLRPARLPAPLRERFRADFGPWHDIGALPAAPGLPSLIGYRDIIPLARSKVTHRLSNRTPWCVSAKSATLLGIDPGELLLRATRSQRSALIEKIRI